MYAIRSYYGNKWHFRATDLHFLQKHSECRITSYNVCYTKLLRMAVIPVFGGVLFGMAKKSGWLSYEETNLKEVDAVTSASMLQAKNIDLKELKGKPPMGKIKDIEISRIIPGGNLVSGFAHSRDLVYVSSFLKNYFTDEKVIETLWLYEACGINTTIMRTDADSYNFV